MNREIKFRAWDIDSSEMLYTGEDKNNPDFFFDFSTGELSLMKPVDEDYPEKRNADIMQYTGLKDKNGKEIYEGDILNYNPSMGISDRGDVVIHDGRVRCRGNIYNHSLSSTVTPQFEIIGNIYENSEILI